MIIGDTPITRLRGIEEHFGLRCSLFGKAEFMNPAGSIKDRIAAALISAYEKNGTLRAGGTIVEATSGNTGIALAMLGALHRYRVRIIMPEGASKERIDLMRAYGAEVILSDRKSGMSGAISLAEEIVRNDENSIMMRQFENAECVKCHYSTTAREIARDMLCNIDAFVCGVGTGATLVGVGRFLKESFRTRIYAVEPYESAVLSGGVANAHGIDGIGAGFVPCFYDFSLVDSVIRISTEEAVEMTRLLARHEGLLVGISSGANLAAAIKIGMDKKWRIALPLCDRGERYFSRGIFTT